MGGGILGAGVSPRTELLCRRVSGVTYVYSTARPGVIVPAVLQANSLAGPVPEACRPSVEEVPACVSDPYTTRMSSLPSVKITSKLALPPPARNPTRHSMMNWRFGGLPMVVVKTPWLGADPRVSRSSQRATTARPSIREGRQVFAHQRFAPVKLTIPFELMFADVKESL